MTRMLWAPLGAFLFTACAPQGQDMTDDQEVGNHGDGTDTSGTGDGQQARSCGEALQQLGYTPWHYTGHDWPDVIGVDIDYELTDRPWLAVLWEADNQAGFRISCDEVGSSPEIEADKPDYWVGLFQTGADPFADEGATVGLGYYANPAGETYINAQGDGVYVPEEGTEE